MNASTTSSSPRRRRFVGLALAVAAVALYVGPRALVSALAADALENRGLSCEPLDIDVAFDLSRVELGPTSCTTTALGLTEVGLPYGASLVRASGLHVRRVVIPELTLELARDADLSGLGAALLDEAVPLALRDALDALAAASSRNDLPSVELAVVRIRRRGITLALRSVSVEHDERELSASIREVELPLHHGVFADLALRLGSIEVRATPSSVRVEARVVLDARIVRREIDAVVPFFIAGSGLDGATPSYTMRVETDIDIASVAERLSAARAPSAAPSDPAASAERLHELAGRTEALRERLEGDEGRGATEIPTVGLDPAAAHP